MNYSYDITPLNREQLAWYIAAISGCHVDQARQWMSELEHDEDLRAHVELGFQTNPERRIGPSRAHWGRRAGWYALVRALRPQHIVETGTALGLGSCVMAAALLRNGTGRLTTIDTNRDAGHLIDGRWGEIIDFRVGDAVAVITGLDTVDLFLHDSLHTLEHELAEFQAVAPHLSPTALVLSDNAHETTALSEWAACTNRRYLFYKEIPANHWWPGAGIGAAWTDRQ